MPTSYLQTLTNDEAIAFIASLQGVKAHLSQELQWMSQQVQQKTAQLQGIETLLAEAVALGLVAADASHDSDLGLPAPVDSAPVDSAPVDEPTSPAESTEPLATTIAALPVKKPATPKQGKSSNTKAGGATASTKSSAAKTKQPKPSTSSAGKANQRGKASNFQGFLKTQWRDKALTEAVGDILNQAAAPLSTDELMAELYDSLPQADYQRVKHSLANILSVGRSKGAWQSTGRGRYAGKATATA